ncbi:MAG: PucR family transcriptional regulator [Coprococcus sp.]
MQITNSIIAYQLNCRLKLKEPLRFPKEQDVSGVFIPDGSPIKSHVLYLISDDFDGTDIQLSEDASYLLLSECLPQYFKGLNICFVSQPLPGKNLKQTAIFFLQVIGQILLDFAHWEQNFTILKIKNADIKEYFTVINQFYPGNLLLVDRDSEILGGDDRIVSAYFGNETKTFDMNQITEMIFTTSFQENCRRKGFFDVVALKEDISFLCCNFQRSGNYLGCLVRIGCGYDDTESGELAVLKLITEILEPLVFSNIEKKRILNKNVEVHKLLYKILTTDIQSDQAEASLRRILKSCGWNEQDSCCVINLCFFESISAINSGTYVCNLLEEQWCHSFAVTVNENIYWVINCSKHKINEFDDNFKRLILNTVSAYICRAGVSNFFQGSDHLIPYINQARTALALGQQQAPHRWYHLFGDYILEYLMQQMTLEYTPCQICHKGLLDLLEYDKIHNTNYVKSLKTYLVCNKNASQAAEQLYLHRTSLIRQLERIERIMGMDLNENYKQDLYLRLSLMLLDK